MTTITCAGQFAVGEQVHGEKLIKAEAISSNLMAMAEGKEDTLAFHFNFDHDSAGI